METWNTLPLAAVIAGHLGRHDYLNARLTRMGEPTDAEIETALRVAGVGRYRDPMIVTVREAVNGAARRAGESAVTDGMATLVEAIVGEQITLRHNEGAASEYREPLLRWVAARRDDLEEGEAAGADLEAAEALAARPPVFLVAAVIDRIADEIRSAVTENIGELAMGDGSDLGRRAVRISGAAWRDAARAWVASRA